MEISTAQIHAKLDRMRNGDLAARDELLRGVGERLEKLARRMLRNYPRVHRWADTDDLHQNSVMRLLRALETVTPATTREFYGLAALQIRRELTDLARRYAGPRGMSADAPAIDDSSVVADAPAAAQEPDLETWARFHQEVERLPAEEREVVSLVFYHDWTQQAVAELFGVDVRTIRRWWQSALLKLQAVFESGGEA